MYFSRKAVEDIIRFAEGKGVDAGIFYKELLKSKKELALIEFVDYETIAKVLLLAVEASQDDFFGLHMGCEDQLNATSRLDDIMAKSFNLEETLSNATQYSRLISDAATSKLIITNDSFRYEFHLSPDWLMQNDIVVRNAIDLALARVKNTIYFLSNRQCSPVAVQFHYPKPKKIEEYYAVFNAPLVFNKSHSAVIFSKQFLKFQNPFFKKSILETLKRYGDDELTKLSTDKTCSKEVKKYIYNQISPDYPSVAEVAKGLSMSRRSLQRKLSEEGSSYKKILLDVRMILANKYLKEYRLSVSETAFFLGYSESAAFIRVFKKHYGITPTRFLKA